MKLRQLEITLEKLDRFRNPDPSHEQYSTPPALAARLLFHAMMNGDITGKRVCDLGCGTGILTIGSALLGAGSVTGIDRDREALTIAEKNAAASGAVSEFILGEIRDPSAFSARYDTVVMNPPFGAQKKHADRPFIDCALAWGDEIYTIENQGSLGFIRAYTKDRATVSEVIGSEIPIPHTFHFHRKEVHTIGVEIIHLTRRDSP
jgi:putative methylase